MRTVAIDVETTGLNYNLHQVIQVGIVADNGNQIEINIGYQDYVISDYCLTMHNYDRRTVPAKEAVGMLGEFLKDIYLDSKPHIIGKNPMFDILFLSKLPYCELNGTQLSIEGFTFNKRFIDPSLYFMTDEGIPSLSECCELAGLPNEVMHTALEDAQQVYNLYLKGKEIHDKARSLS